MPVPRRRFGSELSGDIDRLVHDISWTANGLLRLGDRALDQVGTAVSAYPGQFAAGSLARQLEWLLYRQFYGRAAPANGGAWSAIADPAVPAPDRIEVGWSGPWVLRAQDGDDVLLERGQWLHLAHRDSIRTYRRRGSGRLYWLRTPLRDPTAQPGYRYLIGREVPDRYDSLVSLRIYLATTVETAIPTLAIVNEVLNRHGIPFKGKTPVAEEEYARADATVLYLPRRFGAVATMLVRDSLPPGLLRPVIPRFTRLISNGIAIADDPPGGASFGLSRTTLLAEALMNAWSPATGKCETNATGIAAVFAARGITPERPWLNAGNIDLIVPPKRTGTARPIAGTRPPSGGAVFLQAAQAIGRRLVRDAQREGNRCTWIGWGVGQSINGPRAGLCTTGADLYAGTAGVALFLARLACVTEDAEMANVAMMALRQSSQRAKRTLPSTGAFTGLSGVAYAAGKIARLLEDKDAQVICDAVVTDLIERGDGCTSVGFDLLDGQAGAILALTAVCDPSQPTVAAWMARSGDFLVQCADEGPSWRPSPAVASRPLNGLAHGTAGIALALYRLGQWSNERRFVDVAVAALHHELAQFDPATGNWPDHRINRHRDRLLDLSGAGAAGDAMVAWCNGATGSILATAAILGRESPPIIHQAIDTVEAKIRANLDEEIADCSLCHGLAGDIETLHELGRLLPNADITARAHQWALRMARRYTGAYWPGGIDISRESTGLMLGNAGIGHFLLRMAVSGIPSVLHLA